MKIHNFIIFFSFLFAVIDAQQAQFAPPKGWKLAESDKLPPHVQVMVVGEGKTEFPPSINLSTEEYHGTLEDYIKIVKNINQKKGSDWKDLGKIKTQAGNASLSQVNVLTKWGTVRMMHVILIKDNTVYILTASALQSEFAHYNKQFLEALRSLAIE